MWIWKQYGMSALFDKMTKGVGATLRMWSLSRTTSYLVMTMKTME